MNPKIKTIKIIHLALSAFVILAYLLIGDFKNIANIEIDNAFLRYSFVPVIAYLLSNFLFKKTVNKIKKESSIVEKFTLYQSACIQKWTVLEVACFLILLLKPAYIILGVVLLFYMILITPKEEKIFEALDIKHPNL
ncbi:MAG: MFS transporter [Polaribacter sp.]|nr:MFS transporter [Polaribacter sp.]MDG1811688.1 MFS transporter [Polaribacter sp.]MDG1993368.1 MFS transporter [Polaribacter sp.]